MAWSRLTKRLMGTAVFGLAAATIFASACAEAEGRFYIQCTLPGAGDGTTCGCAEGTDILSEGTYNVAGCAVTDTGELAGVCFDPTGDTLFVNLQHDGLTLAIRGPMDELFGA